MKFLLALLLVPVIGCAEKPAKLPPPVIPTVLSLELVNDYNRARADQLEARAAVAEADATMNKTIQAIWKVCGGKEGVELNEKRDPKCKDVPQKEPSK